jgi:hypothetical protein
MQMSDEEVERGAAVWDTIASLESGRLTDGNCCRRRKSSSRVLASHARRRPQGHPGGLAEVEERAGRTISIVAMSLRRGRKRVRR